MECKDPGREPGPGKLQPLKDSPQQEGCERMKRNIEKVVGKRPGAPQFMFDPKTV